MENLEKHIRERLATHPSCTIFESGLERVWPRLKEEQKERAAAIEAFARKHGWKVTINDPGIRVTFRKL